MSDNEYAFVVDVGEYNVWDSEALQSFVEAKNLRDVWTEYLMQKIWAKTPKCPANRISIATIKIMMNAAALGIFQQLEWTPFFFEYIQRTIDVLKSQGEYAETYEWIVSDWTQDAREDKQRLRNGREPLFYQTEIDTTKDPPVKSLSKYRKKWEPKAYPPPKLRRMDDDVYTGTLSRSKRPATALLTSSDR